MIGTQFETDAAREAFVCVDEPDAKATFDLAIKFDEQPGEQVLSNMPEKVLALGSIILKRLLKCQLTLSALF